MRAWTALGLAVLLIAGCFGGDGADDGRGGEGLTDPGGAYILDCSIASADWDEPCLAWSSRNDSPSKTEIDLAVNPTDPLNVFVASKDMDPLASPGPCVWAVGQVTHDGGHTWTTVYVGGTLDERGPTEPLFGWRCITDPILQFTPRGVLHYSLQAYDYEPVIETPGLGTPVVPGGNMYTALSTDGGATFSEIKLLLAGDGAVLLHDYMRMTHNPVTGTVFTLWNQFTAGATLFPVVVAVERDGTVRPPVHFASAQAPGMLGIHSLVGSPDGTLHVFLQSDDPGLVHRSESNDDGRVFSAPGSQFRMNPMQELPDVEFRSESLVEAAADASGGERHGCLYTVWADGGSDVADILLRRSCDRGSTWADPVRVSNGPHEGAQFFPRVSVDGRGTVHVVYHTQAYDPGRTLLDVEWARSTDGGATWTIQRLTQVHSDGDLGIHQDGGPFFGDYIGIGSSGDHTYMAFPVTVTGRAEIAVAHVEFRKN